MLLDLGIITLCLTVLFLLYKTETLERQLRELRGLVELVWRRFKNMDNKD